MNIDVPQAAIDLVKKWEGCSLKPYLCPAGIATIGIGSTTYSDNTPVKLSDPEITQEIADDLLLQRLTHISMQVIWQLGYVPNDNQLSALISFGYNVGYTAFKTSTLLKKAKLNSLDPSIRDEFMRWNKVGRKVVRGLVKRRIDEANLYFTLPVSTQIS